MMGQQAIPAPRGQTQEAELARALAARDPHAWRQLFEEQYDRVYRYAFLRTRNTADAEDVASTTFAEAARGIGSFQYRGTPVAAWLLRIAHNETVDLLKRRARTRSRTAPLAADDAPDAPLAPDAARARDEWRDVAEAAGSLKPEQREVLQLRLIEGRPVKEVAAALGKSEGAVKVTQMRALQALRKKLGR